MSFSSEEIAKIHVVINSGDIPDFSIKITVLGAKKVNFCVLN